jgi:hypothetical protein
MKHEEKKPKVGPREQQLRDMREAKMERVEANKRLIDKKTKTREIATVIRTKGKPPKARVTKVVKKRSGRGR